MNRTTQSELNKQALLHSLRGLYIEGREDAGEQNEFDLSEFPQFLERDYIRWILQIEYQPLTGATKDIKHALSRRAGTITNNHFYNKALCREIATDKRYSSAKWWIDNPFYDFSRNRAARIAEEAI
jgi:hypothetical protein